ncbi:hydroxyacylglutathione hydrolase [Marinobacter persicus]|uniref:Hydroxyacylglutathione hydrolase n=2 Tax=Marinobacter persicus TaxID=930118 RepID=A0A1I3TYN1_9GAMM|nr:hydroxyacylglutathione hydrolase [Marinobacter persicus]
MMFYDTSHTRRSHGVSMFSIRAIPAFNDNYIWCLSHDDSGRALIVDPGQAGPVLQYLKDQQLTADTILVTHHHPDHTGGVGELEQAFPDVRITGPADSPFKGVNHVVHPGDEVVWQGLTFNVMAVPGHTLDHIAYFTDNLISGRPLLFAGDTLFACGCGRLFEGSAEQMHRSLATLRELPEETAVYCAHEYTLANLRFARSWLPDDEGLREFEQRCQQMREQDLPTIPTTLAEEKALNPFLRWDDPAVMAVARRYGAEHGLPVASDADIFAAIRHGKDNF